MQKTKPKDIDEYISGFPKNIQDHLQEIRNTVKNAAPDATEAIKYDMPTFMLSGNLVHFAAFKNHIGFYPVPRNSDEFKEELSDFKGEKSTVQFSFDKPLPLDLIDRIVRYQVKKNLGK
ncbi:iron chaperone [Dyadobacter psychrotolerans]|uniref:YdhG-like domain-containing protein n=1 Tax=Dyadobacter psychrotolerans TaxID=2541721 RepID=A0A4R5DQ94_9BACT|nr:DUF1801 domain-containing protein [Dyadobacter psychrotolerans]TDE16429.1 hypothetical protein E0F88_09320 [Dyadobacter psychrotolerans]